MTDIKKKVYKVRIETVHGKLERETCILPHTQQLAFGIHYRVVPIFSSKLDLELVLF